MPNVKMGADISSFKSGISAAKSEVRTLDQQMKMIDATFKATGNSEQALSQKTQTLNQRMTAQKNMAKQAEEALKAMTQAGVDPASESYQKMAREMLAAQTGMMETQAALNDLGNGAVQAAGGVSQLESGLSGISKKISLDQVISGIGKITSGLETAAKRAVSLGQSIFDNIMNAAQWADDTATMAMMYGIDLDTFQRMQKLVVNGMDTSVDAILKSQSKLKKGIGDDSKATLDALKELGVGMRSGEILDPYSWAKKDPTEMFWEAGQALMALGDEYEKESKAQALFGRSWHELVPLFDQFKNAEEFAAALKEVNVNSADDVTTLATLNDKMGLLKGNFDTLSRDILAQFAPGLISMSESLNGLLQSVMDYLKTDEGKEMLKSMSDSFLGLFDGLRNISAEDVVSKFESIFSSIVDGFKWVKENGDTLLKVLEGIGVFWAGLKVSEGALTLLKLVDGLKSLLGAGAAAGAAGGGAGAGLTAGIMAAVKNAWTTAGGMSALAPLGVFTAATLPAEIVMNQTREKWQKDYNRRMNAAALPDNNAWFISQAAETLGLTGQVKWENAEALLMGLSSRQNQQKADLYNILKDAAPTAGHDTWNLLNSFWGGAELDPNQINEMLQNITDAFAKNAEKVKVPVEPELPQNVAQMIQEAIGTVTVAVNLTPGNTIPGYANGITFVPDRRLAWLHPGETVTAAREVTSRNYSSNLYVEKMIMGGGTDARGLADEMAAAQRRTIEAYGG